MNVGRMPGKFSGRPSEQEGRQRKARERRGEGGEKAIEGRVRVS